MSSSLVSSESVILTEPCAISCGSPMASSTCDGSRDPEVHADPDDAHIPLRSSMIRSDSPSTNLKLKFALFGSLIRRSPLSFVWGISSSTRSISLSRSFVSYEILLSILSRAILTASANPITAGAFVVPALFPCSCAPPWIRFDRRTPDLTYNMPIPLGPFIL